LLIVLLHESALNNRFHMLHHIIHYTSVALLNCLLLCLQVLSGEQVQKGFARLVESLDDLLLDVPDAVELLSLFIARGVVRAADRYRLPGLLHRTAKHYAKCMKK
jgi:hypothetical protein